MRKYIILAMLVGVFSTACGQENVDTELTWHHDFDTASAEAEESGKLMLIDMYADWCGPCVTLGEDYFTSDIMEPILSELVLLKLDVDSQEGGVYAQQYGVSSIPCVVIARANGTEIDRIVGTTPTIEGYAAAVEEILSTI